LKRLQLHLARRQHKRQWEKETRKARTGAEQLRLQNLTASEQEQLAHEQAKRETLRQQQRADFLRERNAALLRCDGAAQRVAIDYS
jgi:hypothetical protein